MDSVAGARRSPYMESHFHAQDGLTIHDTDCSSYVSNKYMNTYAYLLKHMSTVTARVSLNGHAHVNVSASINVHAHVYGYGDVHASVYVYVYTRRYIHCL